METDNALTAFQLELAGSGHAPRTVSEYRKTVRRWQRSGLPPIEYLAAKHVKLSSRTKEGLILRQFLAWAVVHGFLPDNPLASVKFKAPAAPLIRPFSQEEIDRLLDACRTALQRAVILALLKTGVRLSELAQIRPQRDVDRAGCTLTIQCGKGGKPRRLALASGVPEALEVLAAAGLKSHAIYKMVKRIGSNAGLEGAHPHRFRHTFAHNFLAAGADRGDLRVLLGHTSYIMVDRYARYWEEERALAAHRRFMDAERKVVEADRLRVV